MPYLVHKRFKKNKDQHEKKKKINEKAFSNKNISNNIRNQIIMVNGNHETIKYKSIGYKVSFFFPPIFSSPALIQSSF